MTSRPGGGAHPAPPRPAPPRGGESRAEPSPATRGGEWGRSHRLEPGEGSTEGGTHRGGAAERPQRGAQGVAAPPHPELPPSSTKVPARAGAVTVTDPYRVPALGKSVSLTSKRRLCTVPGERRDTEGNKSP